MRGSLRAYDAAPLSDHWFRLFAEATATAIFVYRDHILYANPALAALTGYSQEELVQMEPWRLVHPDFRDLFRERCGARARQDGAASRLQLRLVRRDGAERWVEFTAGHVDDGGELLAIGAACDITELKLADLSLRETQERLRLAQQAGRAVIWEWNLVTDELVCSDMVDDITGFSFRDQVRTGTQFVELVHPDDRERMSEAIRRTFHGDDILASEIRVVLPTGSLRWIAEQARAVRDASGRVVRLIGVGHDITERKLAEEALFQEKERAQVTLASIADGVIRTDARGSIDFMNPVAETLTGWTLGDAYGRPLRQAYRVVDEETLKPLVDPVERCLREKRQVLIPGSRFLLHREGSGFPIQDSAAPIRNRNGELMGAVLVFKDLTQLRQMEREVDHLASRDPLTGLANRAEFEIQLLRAVKQAQSVGDQHALCFLDLDDFKLINDTCGHAAGDELIKQTAGLISGKLAEGDLVARIGGDEFAVLLRDRTAKEARQVAEAILEAAHSFRFSWEDRIFAIGLSVGLVPVGPRSKDHAALLSAADAASHIAREAGRNRIHEYQPGDTALAARYGEMQWISRIHRALDEERLCLYQQRIYALDEKAEPASFCEVLVRMRDEDGNLIKPSVFIPAAERYHLVSEIDRWVVRTAFASLAKARQGGNRHTRFAINLSGQSLSEETFLDYVAEEFEASGLPPERILFEITETAAIADLPHAMRFMYVFRGMGCHFVLDDFGKGLSSFAYLRNLEVDFLKIDGEFVRSMVEDPMQAALVESINQIGHVLGIRTIAESVETRATLEALRALGVDFVQGNWVAKPAPLDPATL